MYLINKDETEHTGQVGPTLSQLLVPRTQAVFDVLPPSVLGVVRVEDVPGALLGLLPRWRLFQEAV